jgi:hypothetical protein
VPETLNRPLPNSVDDVVKWHRNLSTDEWKVVNELNKKELKKIKKIFKCCNTKECKQANQKICSNVIDKKSQKVKSNIQFSSSASSSSNSDRTYSKKNLLADKSDLPIESVSL